MLKDPKLQAKWEQEFHKKVISSLTLAHNMPWVCLTKPHRVEEDYEKEGG